MWNHFSFVVDVFTGKHIYDQEGKPNNENLESGFSSSEPQPPVKWSWLEYGFHKREFLGKGGFGVVWKVRSKVDRRDYALKRVNLSRQRKEENKKIKREVRLLSGLNHKHIVRYFTSWVERGFVQVDDESTNDSERDDSEYSNDSKDSAQILENDGDQTNSQGATDFDACEEVSDILSDFEELENSKVNRAKIHGRILCILIEFCKNSTLRQAIDNGSLIKDFERSWRLFREIVDGVAYIHERGLIHRDLKPDNIFLDSNDNAKIGDFGFATRCFSKQMTDLNISNEINASLNSLNSMTEEQINEFTNEIGTFFYMAPEVKHVPNNKKSYTQLVDIFSIGIILFEMFYRPLKTTMERFKILHDIRMPNFILPKDFSPPGYPKFIPTLLRSLLQHNTNNRPNASVILNKILLLPPLGKASITLTNFVKPVSNATIKNTEIPLRPGLKLTKINKKKFNDKGKQRRKSTRKNHPMTAKDQPQSKFPFSTSVQSKMIPGTIHDKVADVQKSTCGKTETVWL